MIRVEELRELRAVEQAALATLAARERDELLVAMRDAIVAGLDASHVACALFDSRGEGALLGTVRGFGRDPALGLQGQAADEFFQVIRTADGLVRLGPDAFPDLLRAMRRVDRRIVRAVFQPVRASMPEGWIGIYQIRSDSPPLDPAPRFLQSIGRFAALGAERIRLVDKLRHSTERLEEAVRAGTAATEQGRARIQSLERRFDEQVKERTRALEAKCRQIRSAHADAIHAARVRGTAQVAASFAHEVNNPVAGLTANLAYMCERLDELRACVAPSLESSAAGLEAITEFEEIIEESQESAQRVCAIIDSLKRLGGEEELQKRFSLNTVVADAVTLLEERIRASSETKLILGSLPDLDGEQLELRHVTLALLTNAVEGIERRKDGRRGRISVATFVAADGVTLTVEDNGCGIAKDMIPRVCDPFVTTKEEPAAGLGLYCAHQAATRRGGTLHVRSQQGEGTKITMLLPVAAETEAGT